MFPTNSECLIIISDAVSAFVYGYPSSCPRAACTPQQKCACFALHPSSSLFRWCLWCPRMLVDILGTSWDQCVSMVQYCFTSTETTRLVRTDSPGRPPRLSNSSWTISYTRRHGPIYILYRSMPVGIYRVQSPGFPKIVYWMLICYQI